MSEEFDFTKKKKKSKKMPIEIEGEDNREGNFLSLQNHHGPYLVLPCNSSILENFDSNHPFYVNPLPARHPKSGEFANIE